MSKSGWPQYDVGPAEHLHALGVIATTMADFDAYLFDLYVHHLDLKKVDRKVSEPYYFEKSDDKRIALLKRTFADYEHDPHVRAAVDKLTKYYEWAAETRGILLHARHSPPILGRETDTFYLAKQTAPKKHSTLGYLKFTAAELRAIADQIRAGCELAGSLVIHLIGRSLRDFHEIRGQSFLWREPLPDIPAPPASLTMSDTNLACTRFRRHQVWCDNGTGGGSWSGGSLRGSSSLRLCA